MKEIKKLIGLWRNKSRTSREVKTLALVHLKGLEEKIVELQEMTAALRQLVHTCHGDSRPNCPILADLEKT
jgi:MerR family gold-responsive transcriptional activator of gol and ges genes